MLNKRFKIAKCKTSLKLATSRIKLLKNKKAIQITQMKRELAQLLVSQQNRTAIIRVEHVIREEKMIEAYDLIEIYCELIVTRLPIIESQKTCPIDLKEAITSVIFAAPRCSDIPELVDARRNFTAKYGKEFVTAALELRPDSGVNRMMVEKLSAVAPDIQTKMKVLSAVAKEHNVNWDPTLFEEKESKPSDDLLNGPVNFEKASMMTVDSPKMQTANVQNVYSHQEKMNVPDNFSEQNRRYTLGTQNVTSIDTNPSGTTSETMNRRHSFQTKTNNSSSGSENRWNMEFKDATSAAQAAAESAERASIAARAAAQLSRQSSTESHKSQIRDKPTQKTTNSQFPQKDPRHHDTSPKAPKTVITKQPNLDSSRSNSITMSDKQKVSKKTDVYHENIFKETIKTNSYDDETDSDDDIPKFDTGFEYDEEDARSFFPSPGREEPLRLIENTHDSSPIKNTRDKEEKQKVNSRKTRIELNDLVERDSKFVRESKKNDRESQIMENSENELKFGTLTGGIRNKGGIKYPPYTKTGMADSSPSSEKLVDQTSKPSSFNSRRSIMEKKQPSVSMSSSESESESESDDQSEKVLKNRSRFAPPDVFLNDGGISDSDEEVVPVTKPTSTRLSRRTKGHVEAEGKTVISRSNMHSSTNESSPTKKKSEQPSNPGKKIVESGKTESPKTSNLSSQTSVEENKVKKPSHVHPKLPDYDNLAAHIQSLQTNRK